MTEEEFDEKILDSILQRNPHLITRIPIHPWRWRGLMVWIIVFTFIVFLGVRDNRQNISNLKHNTARVASLERTNRRLRQTNCRLRDFLVLAHAARLKTAQHDHDPIVRATDLKAAEAYAALADAYAVSCANRGGRK